MSKEKEYPKCVSCGRAFNPDAKEGDRKGIIDKCIECINQPVKEDKRRWPAIRAEEKLSEFGPDRVTIINGKSQFHFGWRKCLDWIMEEYEITPKDNKSADEFNTVKKKRVNIWGVEQDDSIDFTKNAGRRDEM